MKQFQLLYEECSAFREGIRAIRRQYPECTAMVQVYYDKARQAEVETLIGVLDTDYPEAQYFGCAANAAIYQGTLSEHTIAVTVTVFEDPTARIEILQYGLTEETQADVCTDLLARVRERPWVKGSELLITIRGMSTTYFCDRLSEMDEGIEIFGGNAFNPNLDFYDINLFSRGSGFLDSGVIFVLIGGETLHIQTSFITGWKPLGAKVPITRAKRNRLYELGGEPAYDFYYRYLQIDNDASFYKNTMEFPISYDRSGVSIMRVPTDCTEDGSLVMSSDVIEGAMAQLNYGDPQTILRSLFREAEKLADFVPDCITIFDCASRRTFWGKEDINRESLPFQLIADTAGFYTAGEFHRVGRVLNQHNVTLVIVGMREGDPGASRHEELLRRYKDTSEHVSMVRRLANFIDVASGELQEANKQLAVANERLTKMAITDELTGVFNRRAIQNRIMQAGKGETHGFSLIMLDLDYFKHINDTFGHDEGDCVLRGFASVMKQCTEAAFPLASVGRWGGEEFMILLPDVPSQDAVALSEQIRKTFAETVFSVSGKHTVSCGVAVYAGGEAPEIVCSRVDDALYEAKRSGRNRTCLL